MAPTQADVRNWINKINREVQLFRIDGTPKEFITNKKMTFKKDPKAWEKFIALRFHGGKEHDCLDVDSAV